MGYGGQLECSGRDSNVTYNVALSFWITAHVLGGMCQPDLVDHEDKGRPEVSV